MKKVVTILLLCGALNASAQGITEEMLDGFREQTLTQAEKALANAIAGNTIDNLAKNYAVAEPDNQFSIETTAQSITNQESSGRCWMFSGCNVIRADFAKRTDSLTLELSHSFLFFYDQLEKANLCLQGLIDCADKPIDDIRVRFFFKNPINDGGTFCGVADLVDKYGLVPKSIMPETNSTDNTRTMSRLISSKLREDGLELRKMIAEGKSSDEVQEAKTKMLGTIYRILTLTIGEPPMTFSYAFKGRDGKAIGKAKTYTPKEFAQEVVGKELNGSFIMVMNDPRREYYKTYEVEYDRHLYDGHNWIYLNLPMEDIEQMAIASLKDGHKLYSSYDVAKMLDRTKGYADTENYNYEALLGTTFGMDKAQRINTFDSGSTHAMTLTAVDLDDDEKATKWKVENSWGASWGQNGCLIMTDRWMREYMFRLVVNKEYVPKNILKLLEQQPIMVMPEDPLFQNDI